MKDLLNRKLSFVSMIALMLLGGCSSDTDVVAVPDTEEPEASITYTHISMDGVIFRQFEDTEDGLYAATSKGVMQLQGEQWHNLTEQNDWDVFDVESVGAGHLVATVCEFPAKLAVDDCEGAGGEFYLIESIDSGVNWEVIESNFGRYELEGAIVSNSKITIRPLDEKVFNLEYDNQTGALYATGISVLAISTDFARTWEVLDGFWQGFAKGYAALTIDFNSFKIWYGGQNAIEQSRLFSHDIPLMETTLHPSMSDLKNEPGTVKNIRFHPEQPNTMYASGEPGIIVSEDGGENWNEFYLNDTSRFYFGLLIDPNNPELMYTSGWNKNFYEPQRFFLERSLDGGQTWEMIEYTQSDDIFGGVWSMHGLYDTDVSTLYFGLYKGGVMKVKITH